MQANGKINEMGITKKYLDNEQIRLEGIPEGYRKDASRIISELPKHLILTSTVFIALSSSILGIKDISLNLSIFDKKLIILRLSLMVLSIFLGLLQYLVDYLFFKKQVESKESIIKLISANKFESIEDYINYSTKESLEFKLESSNIPIIFQSIFLFLGVCIFTFIIYSLLF